MVLQEEQPISTTKDHAISLQDSRTFQSVLAALTIVTLVEVHISGLLSGLDQRMELTLVKRRNQCQFYGLGPNVEEQMTKQG
jgi:hypothetical protein